MSDSKNAIASSLLEGFSWILFLAAGLCFWVGGRAISEFTKTDRTLAEVEGIGLTVVFAGLGAVTRSFAERVDEDVEEQKPMYDPNFDKN
jgi:hypothetical protein